MTPKKAISDYAKCLQLIRDQQEVHDKHIADLTKKLRKIESYLIENVQNDLTDIPEIVYDERPFVAWSLEPKTDLSATRAFMQLRDGLKSRIESKAKEQLEEIKQGIETLENWALQQLNERGGNNFNTDFATVSRTTVKSYKIEDKTLFIKDAIKHKYSSELGVSIRPNSSLMKDIFDERGELPPGISSSVFFEARFTKPSK